MKSIAENSGDLEKRAAGLVADNRIEAANAVYEQLYRMEPDNVDVLVGLGITRRRLGRVIEAEQACRRALSLQADHPPAHLALGAALQQQGRLEDALACYRSAVRLDPDYAEACYFLGNALRESGRLDEAKSAYRRLLQLRPDHFEGLNNLGSLLHHTGENSEALLHLQRALQLKPDDVHALTNMGNVCVSLGRYAEALEHLRHAVRINPGFAGAQGALANALHHAGQLDQALECYRTVSGLQPDSRDAVLGQARILEQLGKHRESYALLEPLLEAGYTDALPQLFDISRHVGRREEAVAGLEGMLQNKAMRDASAAAIHFKLGRHYDETGDYERAFHHYQQANSLTAAEFDREKLVEFVNRSISTYTREFVHDMPRAGNTSRLPVFIVGMPRSGTSLIEQILASHPDVYGAGELPHIGRIVQRLSSQYPAEPFPLPVRQLAAGALDAAACAHLAELQVLGGGAARVTDKMPYNFRHIGLLAQLFPAAAIIHSARHPLDTCLSCYFANFGTVAHSFAYSLQTIGEYYLQYRRLMRHWESVLPGRMVEIPYSGLVREQEETSRQLLDVCALAWNDRCLAFHTTDRFVFTLSYDQVRQPLYTRSLGRWRHYEKQLRPLRELLEAGGVACD